MQEIGRVIASFPSGNDTTYAMVEIYAEGEGAADKLKSAMAIASRIEEFERLLKKVSAKAAELESLNPVQVMKGNS